LIGRSDLPDFNKRNLDPRNAKTPQLALRGFREAGRRSVEPYSA
jgi:hypothetical protein